MLGFSWLQGMAVGCNIYICRDICRDIMLIMFVKNASKHI